MMLRIGEFSRRGRVSVKALRHYEAIGLLRPAHVDAATGYRSYATGRTRRPAPADGAARAGASRWSASARSCRRIPRPSACAACSMNGAPPWPGASTPSRHDSPPSRRASGISKATATPHPGAVVRDVPAAFVASLRRVVPDYGVVNSLFDEITRALPETARIASHTGGWHHCAQHKQIDRLRGLGAAGAAGLRAQRQALPAPGLPCGLRRPSQRRGGFRLGARRGQGRRRQPAVRDRGADARALFLERRRQPLRPHRDPVSPAQSQESSP